MTLYLGDLGEAVFRLAERKLLDDGFLQPFVVRIGDIALFRPVVGTQDVRSASVALPKMISNLCGLRILVTMSLPSGISSSARSTPIFFAACWMYSAWLRYWP